MWFEQYDFGRIIYWKHRIISVLLDFFFQQCDFFNYFLSDAVFTECILVKMVFINSLKYTFFPHKKNLSSPHLVFFEPNETNNLFNLMKHVVLFALKFLVLQYFWIRMKNRHTFGMCNCIWTAETNNKTVCLILVWHELIFDRSVPMVQLSE